MSEYPLPIEQERKLMRSAVKGIEAVTANLKQLAESLDNMLGDIPLKSRNKYPQDTTAGIQTDEAQEPQETQNDQQP